MFQDLIPTNTNRRRIRGAIKKIFKKDSEKKKQKEEVTATPEKKQLTKL